MRTYTLSPSMWVGSSGAQQAAQRPAPSAPSFPSRSCVWQSHCTLSCHRGQVSGGAGSTGGSHQAGGEREEEECAPGRAGCHWTGCPAAPPPPCECSPHCLPATVLVPMPGVTAGFQGAIPGRRPGLQTPGASCGALVIVATATLGTDIGLVYLILTVKCITPILQVRKPRLRGMNSLIQCTLYGLMWRSMDGGS